MKNAVLFLAVCLTSSGIFSAPTSSLNHDFFKTIILINGTPFLVEMNSDGDILENYAMVPDYFETEENHEIIVARVSDEYDSEMAMSMTTRLIIFDEDQALLNDFAVHHIREVATLYSKGYLQNVNIVASHSSAHDDEALAAYRIETIYQLLKDFGVREGDISADMKIYKSDLPNQFVKIDLLK
jgi:hypothetical protein